MLVPKLLRLDEVTIQEVEELAQKLSEKEYTSFSALVRKLIRTGVDNMKTPKLVTDTVPFALADSAREETKLVKEFLERVGNSVYGFLPSPTDEDIALKGGSLRVIAHLRSVYKMDHPGDFQSICAISRALFEIVVDFALITRNPQDFPVKNLLSWEESAKLKHAETVKLYYDTYPLKKNDKHWREYPKASKELCDFITNNSARIKVSVRKPGHSDDRWTGRDLRQSAAAADKVSNYELEQYYILRHSPLCWDIHGSGLIGVKNISQEDFPGISALAFHDCAELAMMVAELIMAKYHITGAFQKEADQLKNDIIIAKTSVISNYPKTFEKMFGPIK